jgi:hypothetical protein
MGRLIAVVVGVHEADDPVQIMGVHAFDELINHLCHRGLPELRQRLRGYQCAASTPARL